MQFPPGLGGDPGSGQHHDVEPRERGLVMAEALAGDPLDAVADHCATGGPFRNCQPKARVFGTVGRGKHGEATVAGTLRPLEDPLELRLARQPCAPWKAPATGRGIQRSGGQSSASLGAASLDHQAPALGLHACAKAVGALALDDAGLKSSLHDCIRRAGLARFCAWEKAECYWFPRVAVNYDSGRFYPRAGVDKLQWQA